MIKKELEMAFAAAVREAQKHRHEMLTVEHLLYALLYDDMGSRILRTCGADIEELKAQLEGFFADKIEKLAEGATKEIIQSIGVQRVLQRAMMHVQAAEKDEMDAGDVLASIFEEEGSYAVYFLNHTALRALIFSTISPTACRRTARARTTPRVILSAGRRRTIPPTTRKNPGLLKALLSATQ